MQALVNSTTLISRIVGQKGTAMNKKLLCLILSVLLLLTALVSCAEDDVTEAPDGGITAESGDDLDTTDTSDNASDSQGGEDLGNEENNEDNGGEEFDSDTSSNEDGLKLSASGSGMSLSYEDFKRSLEN